MLFTASTVKDSVAGLEQFVARNLANGVDHMFCFVDDFDAKVTAKLNRNPHVTAIATGPNWWHGKRPQQLNARQRINANVAKAVLAAVAAPDDWIFHIDGDEVLVVDRAALSGVPAAVEVLRAPPWEAVSRAKWPAGRVTHFKRMLEPDELNLLHVLGAIEQPANGHYFHGHVEGKSGVRPRLDRWTTLHGVQDVDQRDIKPYSDEESPAARLLHYESWSGEEFVRKWLNIIESGTKASFRPVREPTAQALRTLVELGLPERRLKDYLIRIFERTTADDFETLRDLGLLVEIDPGAGTQRPQAAGERGAQLAALFAAVEPENKWPFHTGRTAASMIGALERSLPRIGDPILAARAATAWTLPADLLVGHSSATADDPDEE